MGFFTIAIGVVAIGYLFVLNFILMSLSGSLREKLRAQSIFIESDSNLAEMTNSKFWSEIRRIGFDGTNLLVIKALRTRRVLYSVAGILVGLVLLLNALKL